AFEFGAGAILVANLDRALEAAAGARISGPVERRLQLGDAIVRRIAKQRAIVHPRWIDDLAGIEHIARIEAVLDLPEVADDACTEHRLVELRPHHAVAVLA